MAFQLSPGVLVTERDITNVIPAVSSSVGAFAGYFPWGPAQEIVTVASENELVKLFGKPTSENATTFFSAANFLAYGNALRLVRTVGSAARNAVGAGSAILVRNADEYETAVADVESSFIAKYPGELGNSLTVSICDSTGWASWNAAYKANFAAAPGTSDYADAKGASLDEVHIVVVDADGAFSGTAGAILEAYANLSVAADAKGSDNGSNYYPTVINNQSKYIWWGGNHPTNADEDIAWGSNATPGVFNNMDGSHSETLDDGVDDLPDNGEINAGYALFINPEVSDISLVITGAHSSVVQQYAIDMVSDSTTGRKDCIVFVSPDLASVRAADPLAAVQEYFSDLARNTSYAVADSGWKRQYDRYNDTYVNVPLNPDIAGLCARTDRTNDPWWSPAGLNRGAIKNVVKLVWTPNQAERDDLYKIGVNSVTNVAGAGIVLYGDKTLLLKPSAFDRINVRRLFITLEKAIATAAKYQLFEFNDVFTRSQFRSIVEPFLRDVRGRRGIYDFRVVCDETNNTGDVIDRNEFVADIYIKPAKSINFIQLNFIATRTSISFEEVGA